MARKAATKTTDILNEYSWTAIPKNAPLRNEAPCAHAIAYKLDDNAILTYAQNYISILKPGVSNAPNLSPLEFYDKMYKATAVGEYIFPFFSDEMRAFQNNFGDQGPLGSQVGSQAGAVMEGVSDTLNMGKAFANEYLAQGNLDTQGAAGSYVETPKFYNYTENENAVDVQFPLINTLDDNDFELNYDLIATLIRINRPHRKSPILIEPPVVWEITIPGYRFIRWASCSVQVNLQGSRRSKIINGKSTIIPEAYTIQLRFTPLITEPNNFEEIYGTIPK